MEIRLMKHVFFRIFISIFCFSNTLLVLAQNEKAELIYVYDPLCTFSYGFNPVVEKLQAELKDSLNFTLMSGGLATGAWSASIKDAYPGLKKEIAKIKTVSSSEFSKEFMALVDSGTYVYNSDIPARALMVFKALKPEKAFEFGLAIQKALFVKALDLNNINTYLDLIRPYDINPMEFSLRFQNSKYQKLAETEFQTTALMGADSFPCLILKKNGKKVIISKGYKPYDDIKKLVVENL